jgi:hypothetical protein
MDGETASEQTRSKHLLLLLLVLTTSLVAAQTSAPPGASPSPQDQNPSTQASVGQSQSQSDLAKAAEQARAARERERAKRSAGSEAVSKLADELSEESEEGAAAPVGYRYYNFKEGNYSILVPADAELEGRNAYGLKLLSSDLMGSRTLVVLGHPIPAEGKTKEEMIRNAAKQYLGDCTRVVMVLNPWGGTPVQSSNPCPGNDMVGETQYFVGNGHVMPVICGYPMTAEDLDPNPHRPIREIVKKYDRERNGYRACATVFSSVRFHERGPRLSSSSDEGAPKKAVVTQALLNSGTSQEGPNTGQVSLGDFARAHRKAVSGEVVTDLGHAAGFFSYAFNYCSKEACHDATLQLPVKARKDEQFDMSYVGLFEFEVPVGEGVAVIQASTGGSTKPGIVSREEFIRTKLDWPMGYGPAVYFSRPGKAEILSEELTTLSGMPARLAAFRNPTAFHTVVTQLAAYMAPGVFVQIRCSVPEKNYSDAQSMCQRVVQSLDVPDARKGAGEDSDDAPTGGGDDDDDR